MARGWWLSHTAELRLQLYTGVEREYLVHLWQDLPAPTPSQLCHLPRCNITLVNRSPVLLRARPVSWDLAWQRKEGELREIPPGATTTFHEIRALSIPTRDLRDFPESPENNIFCEVRINALPSYRG